MVSSWLHHHEDGVWSSEWFHHSDDQLIQQTPSSMVGMYLGCSSVVGSISRNR